MAFKELCALAVEKLSAGEDLMLVTIIDENGSSPRSAGARMLAGSEGRLQGTIGGGAVEYKALGLALELLAKRSSRRKTYRLRKNDQEDLGMICGGDVDVYFQFIEGGDKKTIELFANCLERLEQDGDLWFITELTLLSSPLMALCQGGGDPPLGLSPGDARQLLKSVPVLADIGDRRFYSEPVNCAGKAFIFGGGHVAEALEPVLTTVGFRCVVFDSREEYVTRERFPTAWDLIVGDFSRIADAISISPNDYVVIVTHNFDAVVEEQILKNECVYVGLIGSRAKAAELKKRLGEMGFDKEALDRVHAPIGIPIKSETPAEIAISIAAEMILARATRRERE
jgi:xanthine dehydrogenase accessory factor